MRVKWLDSKFHDDDSLLSSRHYCTRLYCSVGSRVKGTLHSKWIRIFERDTGLGKRGNESVESWPVNFLCQCYVRVMTDDGKQFVCYFDNLN